MYYYLSFQKLNRTQTDFWSSAKNMSMHFLHGESENSSAIAPLLFQLLFLPVNIVQRRDYMTAISIIYWHFKEKLSYTEYNYHNKNTTMYVFISRYIVELEVSSLVERVVTTKKELIVLYFFNHWRKCWFFQSVFY